MLYLNEGDICTNRKQKSWKGVILFPLPNIFAVSLHDEANRVLLTDATPTTTRLLLVLHCLYSKLLNFRG